MRKFLILLFAICYLLFAAPGSAFAQTASLALDPSSGTFNRGCNFSLNIKLTTGSVQADGVDVILFYDASRVTATSITDGTLFAEYPGSNIDTSAGKVTIMALASVSSPFSGTGTFATINFTVPETSSTGATRITFDFDPNDKAKTVDSNVVQRGTTVDVLNSVVNGNYTIGSGTCSAQASAAPSASPVVVVVPVAPGTRQLPGTGDQFVGTPSGQVKTIDQLVDVTGKGPGTFEFTSVIAIVGGVLTVLGILGLALL